MECPHCRYKHGFGWHQDGEDGDEIFKETIGKSGGFFSLPIEMTRSSAWESPETKRVYGCPNCGKLFIGDIK